MCLLQSGKNKVNEPFRRVRVEEVEVDHRLQDNSFEAKVIKQLSIF
jgi:hypothetical protein